MTWKVLSPFLAGMMSVVFMAGCQQSVPARANATPANAVVPTPADTTPVTVVAAKPAVAAPRLAAPRPRGTIQLRSIGQYQHGSFAKLASEIPAYDTRSKRLFVANVEKCAFDILDVANPASPTLVGSVSAKLHGDKPTSVSVRNGMIAMSVVPESKAKTGRVMFVSPDGEVLKVLEVGHEPDMLTFSPDGHWLLVANEGEPNQAYDIDPEGTISLIDVSGGIDSLTQQQVQSLDFHAFSDRSLLDPSIRIFGKNASVAQDLEPEYITVSKDSKTAWVVCQENNALVVVDLTAGKITRLIGLGFKDHHRPGQGLDASDHDQQVRIQPWPVKGMYQPDAIQNYLADGATYLVTANEGDGRSYDGFNEETRVGELKLDPSVFPDASSLQSAENLGRLRTTKYMGDRNGDGLHEELYSYGARSFSIWNADGQLVFDSGDQFEQITAELFPRHFNADNESDKFDNRSDKKGPEPEGVAVGEVAGGMYAFIGLERMGGVMVYDISQPRQARFDSYVNTREVRDAGQGQPQGDLGPEGLLFIAAQDSPHGKPLLVVCNEVSGTTRIFEVAAVQKSIAAQDSN